jgi:hypothetical protein
MAANGENSRPPTGKTNWPLTAGHGRPRWRTNAPTQPAPSAAGGADTITSAVSRAAMRRVLAVAIHRPAV